MMPLVFTTMSLGELEKVSSSKISTDALFSTDELRPLLLHFYELIILRR